MADIGGTSSARTVFQIEDMDTQVDEAPHTGEFVEIKCDLNSLNYQSGKNIDEQGTLCGTQKDYGRFNGTIGIGGLYSGDVDRAYRLLKKAQTASRKIGYKYGPGGSDTGDYGLSGIAIVGQIDIGAQVDQLQQITGSLGIDGQDFEFTW